VHQVEKAITAAGHLYRILSLSVAGLAYLHVRCYWYDQTPKGIAGCSLGCIVCVSSIAIDSFALFICRQ
ncbi:MAG: hypothetical protein MI924_30930, partial [Chloroflexales bacterium]|nr:hypothetical protein [Chloroflexales bacterium]